MLMLAFWSISNWGWLEVEILLVAVLPRRLLMNFSTGVLLEDKS